MMVLWFGCIEQRVFTPVLEEMLFNRILYIKFTLFMYIEQTANETFSPFSRIQLNISTKYQ